MSKFDLKETLALGCRILAAEGQEDLTLGHMSARIPGTELLYTKPRGLALAEIEIEDIVTMHMDGHQVEGKWGIHSEMPIHTEIYKMRPEVGCVIHTHPLFCTAFSSVSRVLHVISHDGVLFVDDAAFFEDTPELITTPEQGRSIAQALGTRRAIFLRNHGIVVAERSVPWAVLTAITLERAVKMQAIASLFGRPEPIPDDLAVKMFPSKYNQFLIDQYWDYFVRRLKGGRPEPT
ncbi:MAG: class II aldolase/adducin family protein [Chloroflexi bacterium]|nr:class II aldolase/adducin family protein [Chloroflexota bacterium]